MKHNGQCGAAELAAADLLAIRARIFAAVTVTFLRVASESGTLEAKISTGGGEATTEIPNTPSTGELLLLLVLLLCHCVCLLLALLLLLLRSMLCCCCFQCRSNALPPPPLRCCFYCCCALCFAAAACNAVAMPLSPPPSHPC